MTITEFLLARIAEDEAAAQACCSRRWSVQEHHDSQPDDDDYDEDPCTEVAIWGDYDGQAAKGVMGTLPGNRADIEHAARHDPARVLAECEAKRRIVELHQLVSHARIVTCAHPGCVDEHVLQEPASCNLCAMWNQHATICDTLLSLASVYADHPDYREEWRL